MHYGPTDRFAITAAGESYLERRDPSSPPPAVEDCRATLAEDDPPCGTCAACVALFNVDLDGAELL